MGDNYYYRDSPKSTRVLTLTMSAPAWGPCPRTISPQNMTMKASSTYLLESQKTGGNRVHSQEGTHKTFPDVRPRSETVI